MQFTEQQQAEFKEQFATRSRRQWIVTALMLAIIVVVSLYGDHFDHPLFMGGFLVVVLGVVAFSLKNWRCPACNGYLGRGMSPRFCPKCGVALK